MIPFDFTVLDLETTGLNPKTDKIIEIGAIRVREGKICEEFSTLVNPGRKLEERIKELTGITDEELMAAPLLEEVWPRLMAFLGTDILVGHRILFDYSFLKKAAVNQKASFERLGIDTLKIARKCLPDLESRRLPDLCRHYGILHHAHRAVDDAVATFHLYEKLAAEFPDETLYAAGPLLYKAKKESPATKAQKEQLYKLIEKHKLVIECDIDKLSRSEASRMADKIRFKYGK